MDSCCPTGYTYSLFDNLCHSIVNASIAQAPSACPCCPVGSTYLDQDGFFIETDPISPSFGQRVQIGNPPPYTGLAGTCVNIVNLNWAIPSGFDTEDCPCCNPGDWYNNVSGECTRNSGLTYPPIPCISCVCPPPDPPPVCTTCSEPQHVPIAFSTSLYDPTKKKCTDCDIIGEPQEICPGGSFMPIQLQDPIINFTLRT